MENIFSLKRFWLLVRELANDNWKIFLISLFILSVPPICIYVSDNKPQLTELFTFYIMILVVVGGIHTSLFFKDWTYTARSTSFLTLPVTALEQIALVLFY